MTKRKNRAYLATIVLFLLFCIRKLCTQPTDKKRISMWMACHVYYIIHSSAVRPIPSQWNSSSSASTSWRRRAYRSTLRYLASSFIVYHFVFIILCSLQQIETWFLGSLLFSDSCSCNAVNWYMLQHLALVFFELKSIDTRFGMLFV